jgi:predicted dehydrogenase
LEEPATETIQFDPVDQYSVLVEAFARGAAAGGPGPVPLEDSIRTMAAIDAVVRSAASGRAEEVERS